LGLVWLVLALPGITGFAAWGFCSGEGAGVLPVCAKAGCTENVSAINETQVRIFVTTTSVMLAFGRRKRGLALTYATPSQVIPSLVVINGRSNLRA
jgi:hypothetical protein